MLNRLLVGDPTSTGDELAGLLLNLRARLVQLEIAARSLRSSSANPRDVALYGPYIGRAYLEIAATTLLARLDPFRVLAAKRHQEADYYETAQRSKSGVQWSGDIVPRDKPPKHLWSVDTRELGCRSLLGPWADALVWIPAFEQFCDAVLASGPVDDWITDLSKKALDGFCREHSSGLESLFSKFSKGVHSELLGQQSTVFDLVSIETDYRVLTQRLTCLALLSHFTEHFCCRIDRMKAIKLADFIGRHWK